MMGAAEICGKPPPGGEGGEGCTRAAGHTGLCRASTWGQGFATVYPSGFGGKAEGAAYGGTAGGSASTEGYAGGASSSASNRGGAGASGAQALDTQPAAGAGGGRYERVSSLPHPRTEFSVGPGVSGVSLIVTVKDMMRTLASVDEYARRWAQTGDGRLPDERFSLIEIRCMQLALREATDRRIEAELKKLERGTAGARLARKLVASVSSARRAAATAWRECK
jgi:hypothetical protein